MNVLRVYLQDEPCGILEEDQLGRLSFSYLESWLETARIPVSLTLPADNMTYGHEQVAPFVANLLPEGQDLRNRLERLLHVEASHDFGLLAAIGRESAGALSFWPEDQSPEDFQPGYANWDRDEFHRWRELSHRQPFQFHGQTVRLSLAGIQAKTALYFDPDDVPFVPVHGAPTTHIIKPRMLDCSPSTVYVEYLSMQLARAVLGELEVPETTIWEHCYRIRRYDRPRIDGRVKRLHQQDFCSALGRMPANKYEGGSPVERLLASCFELIDLLGRKGTVAAPVLERQRLLRQVILNVLLYNPDAHLKNYALTYSDSGAVQVAPLYDCICTYRLVFRSEDPAWHQDPGFAVHTRQLSLQIGNAVNIDQVTRQDWERFATECGFTAAYVKRQVRELADALNEKLPMVTETVLDEHPGAKTAVESIRKAVAQQTRLMNCG